MTEKDALLLVLMSIGAFIMPFTSKRLMLPSSVAEIIFGIIIASVFKVSSQSAPLVNYFSTFGFLVLMYLAGLELNFDRIRQIERKDIWLYIILFVPMAIAASIFAIKLDLHWSFTLIFFTTGIGLLFPVLKDLGLVKTDFGQNLLIIGMIGEILTLIGLTIVTLTYKYGFTKDSLIQLAYIASFLVSIYIILRIVKVVLWWHPTLQSLFLLVGNPTETGLRANFVILFFYVALAAVLQIELVVGAFIGGMMFAIIFKSREAVLEKLGGIGYGFFVPIFFMSVGMRVTFNDFVQSDVIILALIITGLLFLTKLIGCSLLIFSSMKNSQIILVATSISFPLTMLVAVSAICFDAGIINKLQSSAILLSAMFSAILYPWVFKLLTAVLMPNLISDNNN